MVDLATLVVKLQAQTAEFTEGLKRGEEATKHLTEVVGEQVNEITKRFLELEALKKAFEFTEKLVEDIARLDELSHAVGVSAEALSKLQYAGKLEGIDDIIVPFTRMARAAGEALQGNEKLTAAFDKVGISIADLRKLTPEELFDKLAENISKYQDGLGKTAIVQQIFGRGQAAFIALLDRGAEGLKESRAEAELFGAALSNESAHAAKEFGDNFKRIEAALTGVFRQALVEDLPLVEGLREKIIDFAKSTDVVQVAAHDVAEGVRFYIETIAGLYDALKPVLLPVVETLATVGSKVAATVESIVHTALPIIKELATGVGAVLTPVLGLVGQVVTDILEIINRVLEQAGPALKVLASQVTFLLEKVGEAITGTLAAFAAFEGKVDLIQEFTDEIVNALKIIATAGAVVVSTFEVVGKYIAGTVAEYEIFQQLPSKSDWLLHPIESTKKFNELNAQAREIARSAFDDINKSFDKGDRVLDQIWGSAAESVKKFNDEVKKASAPTKPPLELDNLEALKQAQKALEELLKIKDKLEGQVNTFGLGSAAATIYDVQFGHISELLAKIGDQSTAQQQKFLELARAQHIISQEEFTKLRAGLRDGVDIAEQLRKTIIEDALALEALKNTDNIQKLDEQILKLSGHEKEAAEAASLLANRQLEASLQQQAAVQALSGLSGSDKVVEAQSRINALQEQATGILHKYESAASEANSTDEKTQSAAIATRTVALAQLQELYIKMRALADASGDQSLVKQAQALQEAFVNSANANGLADIEAQKKRNEQLAEYNDLQKQAQTIQAQLADQIAQINDLQSQGAISELDSQEKQDEARQKAIDQLEQIHEKMGEIAADSDNPAIKDGFTKMGTSVTQLHTQLNQLGKSIRDDFVNESSSAFSDFVLGTKSASAAAKEFLQGIESDLIRLINKHLFEQLFEGSFGGSPGGGVGGSGFNIGSLLSLFGGGAGVGASADALATSTLADYSSSFALAEIALAEGGPVRKGQEYLVGEEGPELLLPVDGGMPKLLGLNGPMHIRAEEPGTVVPHDLTKQLVPDVANDKKPSDKHSLQPTNLFDMPEVAKAEYRELSSASQQVLKDHKIIHPEDQGLTPATVDYSSSFAYTETPPSKLAEGGAVTKGQEYLVGEEGPELLLPDDGGMPKLLGLNGPMHIRAKEPGTVVPHDLTEQLVPDAVNDKKPSDKHSIQPAALFDMPEVARSEYRELSSASQQVLKDHKIIHPEDQGLTPATTDYSSSFAYAPSELAKGGPVRKGQEYLVAEEGPELLIPDYGGMPKLLGLNGPTHIRAEEPGTVVPHDLTEQLVPDAGNGKKPSDKYSIPPSKLFDMPEAAKLEYKSLSDASQQFSMLKDHEIVLPESYELPSELSVEPAKTHRVPQYLAGMLPHYDAFYQLERRGSGGGVNSDQPYLVGEYGPEVMVPATSGTVVPNDAIQGKTISVTNNFQISAPTGTVSRATQSQIAANAARAVQMANHRNN